MLGFFRAMHVQTVACRIDSRSRCFAGCSGSRGEGGGDEGVRRAQAESWLRGPIAFGRYRPRTSDGPFLMVGEISPRQYLFDWSVAEDAPDEDDERYQLCPDPPYLRIGLSVGQEAGMAPMSNLDVVPRVGPVAGAIKSGRDESGSP